MNPALFSIVVIAFQFLTAVALLYLAGGLIELGLHRKVTSGPRDAKGSWRLTRDLRGLEDALVEFVAGSTESRCILSVLADKERPLWLPAIAREARLAEDRHHEGYLLSPAVALAVLSILQLAGIVRITRRGFVITEVGREVHRRIQGIPAASAEGNATPEHVPTSNVGEPLRRELATSQLTNVLQPAISIQKSTTVKFWTPHRTLNTQEKV